MRIAQIKTPAGSAFGAVIGDEIHLFEGAPTYPAVLAGQCKIGNVVYPLANAQLLAPMQRPGKILAIGLNYMDHCREQGTPVPEKPLIFTKFTTAINNPGGVIEWSASLTQQESRPKIWRFAK